MRPRTSLLTITLAIVLSAALAPLALAKGVQPRFDLADPAGAPFPSDRLTVPDANHLTGLRVNLPKPDCSVRSSDCQDIDILNTLDGFNLQPRLSIPLTGPIDVATVTSETVFLLSLGPDRRFIGINQLVWDPARNAIHVESDEFLEQHARYLLVVTDGVRDTVGDPIESAPFRRLLSFGQTMSAADKAYRDSLKRALERLEAAGVSTGRVAAASLFTTQSTTAVMEKIRDQIKAATPAPADFRLGSSGEQTVFPLAEVTNIQFDRQVGTAPAFQTSSYPLGLLMSVPGAVGAIAFGKYSSPDYEAAGAFIPPVGTLTGVPEIQAVNDVYFDLLLPSAIRPADGWPVVIYGHGFNTNKSTSLRIAAKLAQHGLATIAVNAVAHGGGPLGTLGVNRLDGSLVSLSAGGRGFDQDGNGTIGTSEGFFAVSPRRLIQNRDGYRQTVIDSLQLVRVVEAGMDVDGDGEPDLDPSRIYFVGGSQSGFTGALFVALEPGVSAGVVSTVGGAVVDVARLALNRPLVGASLAARIPSLLNGGPDPLLPTSPFPFRENLPLRNQPPVINDIPGAIAIQEQFDHVEWNMQSGDPVAYAPYLGARPLAGQRPKAVLILFAKGDKRVPNPTTTAFLRAGGLAGSATYFRNDLAYAADPVFPKDPHEFWLNIGTAAATTAVALAAEEQIATFLASDGQLIVDPDGSGQMFETPIMGPLPEELSYIP